MNLSARFTGFRNRALPALLLLLAVGPLRAGESEWIDLFGGKGLDAWKGPTDGWVVAGDAEMKPDNPRLLADKPGKGVLVNGPKGQAPNLVSKQEFGDIEVHVEFMVPKRSNSGVKLMGLYEIQILDSWEVKEPAGSDCGGIYPRAELTPTYHHIDKGVPPRVNAARPPGEWQTLDITFRAPRFDAKGKKTASARFVKVVLNGQAVHEDVEVTAPTGHAWHNLEVAAGPLLLQGDHGPVAFRNVRVRLLRAADPGVAADFVLRGATLHDGSGAPGVVGDLAIRGDRIVAVGRFAVAGSPRTLDARGLVVAPGFIDLHTHSDYPLQEAATRANLCYLLQGVTTVVTGNCGSGPVDVAAYYKSLETGKVGSNVAHQVPHNAVRRAVMKNVNRAPTAAELRRMEQLVEQGMRDGAWGLSTGLIYNPGTYSRTDELIALARVAARHGGFYASHIRDEGAGVLVALEEALTIGREAGLPVHISHLKASGRKAWGMAADEVALITRARQAGQAVTADQYPYAASSTNLAATLIPARYREGERKDFLARLQDPEQGPAIRAAVEERLRACDGGRRIRIAHYAPRPAWQGKDLEAVALAEKKTPLEVVLEIERNGGAQIINFSMSEEDVRLIMKQPWVATASDGGSTVPAAGTVPHPRSYGCFARKVGRFAVEDKVVSLEHALRSASGLPADILRLPERGYLKPGYFADVVVFDPETFRDRATYDKPHQYATGVRYLFVNGQLAVSEGKFTGALAGKVLRDQSGGKKSE
jgi:N-acyl-D-aspartate/D-glutamate deacylase